MIIQIYWTFQEKFAESSHYFKEGHPYFDTDVLVIGGKNSAIDAALELNKAGANVTVVYRGDDYSPSIKPWVLPEFEGLVEMEKSKCILIRNVTAIDEHTVC